MVTLGCKVNQYDTAVILNQLPKSKYRTVPFDSGADIYVIDSCTVTHKADAEARQYVNRARRANPDAVIVLTGCYAQVASEELSGLEGVDYIVGNSHKFSSLIKLVREGTAQESPSVHVSDIFNEKRKSFETPGIDSFPGRTRAFLKVQDGCNYACTFCIIPRARGRSRSLDAQEIINRIGELAGAGFKEVVLTGIHIASYGTDIGTDLLSMLRLLDEQDHDCRLRLTSLDPADVSNELVDFVAESRHFCPQFHVALQSGDPEVLRRMRRRYTPERFLEFTDYIRERMPHASIGSDIMVGFPGETPEQFQNTCRVADESALTYFHVFPYSRRKMTPAAGMEDQIAPEVIKERSKILRKLGESKKKTFYKQFIGRSLPMIMETRSRGTTDNYIAVRLGDGNVPVGTLADVRITGVAQGFAKGSIIANTNTSI